LSALVEQLRTTNTGLREVVNGQAAQVEAQAAQLEAQAAQLEAQAAQLEAQAERIAELERRLSTDSTTSGKPPSSDSPYRKPTSRSSRKASGRKPGKQPGEPGSTMGLVADPDEVITHDPGCCRGCGADVSGAPVCGVSRRQVTDVRPPPPPWVTEHRLLTRRCPHCAATSTGEVPPDAPARAQYGPRVLARAAELLCGHYLPVGRAAALMSSLLGVSVSTGFCAGVRARAARRLEVTFLPRVRELLRGVGVLHADETPGRADGALEYVHVAATDYLTVMHTGGRSRADIDAGDVLGSYAGTIVRDGYAGYTHLVEAHHAWCGAHLLRDLRAVAVADPDGQLWAQAMAGVLTDAHQQATAARAAGTESLDDQALAALRNHYRGAAAKGVTDNTSRAGPAAREALRLARRFRDHEPMILRFVVDLAVPFTNNQAERDLRPVKIQQRTSGGAWRTLTGLADFAVVRSYLSTAAKWGLDSLDALEQLFTTGAWLPPAAAPC